MLRLLTCVFALSITIGCGDSVVRIPKAPDHGDRVTDLERKMQLVEDILETKADVDRLSKLENETLESLKELRDILAKLCDKNLNEELEKCLTKEEFLSLEGRLFLLEMRNPSIVFDVDVNITVVSFLSSINIKIENTYQNIADLEKIKDRLAELEKDNTNLKKDVDLLKQQIGDLKFEIENLKNPSGSSGVSGDCIIKKTDDWGEKKHYTFSLNNSHGFVGDYKIVLKLTNNSATLTNNNGSDFVKNSNEYVYSPINNVTELMIYSNGNETSLITSAEVVKNSDNTKKIACVVENSTN